MENSSKAKTIELKVYSDGSKFWCQNGKYHRDNDQPAIIDSDGLKAWFQNGIYIREEIYGV